MYQRPVAATILSMELSMAHPLASRTRLGQRNRFGDTSAAELVQSGLTGVEMAVLEPLTHFPGERSS